jgi:hypothetical protein
LLTDCNNVLLGTVLNLISGLIEKRNSPLSEGRRDGGGFLLGVGSCLRRVKSKAPALLLKKLLLSMLGMARSDGVVHPNCL